MQAECSISWTVNEESRCERERDSACKRERVRVSRVPWNLANHNSGKLDPHHSFHISATCGVVAFMPEAATFGFGRGCFVP
jgi:hypothetical protein